MHRGAAGAEDLGSDPWNPYAVGLVDVTAENCAALDIGTRLNEIPGVFQPVRWGIRASVLEARRIVGHDEHEATLDLGPLEDSSQRFQLPRRNPTAGPPRHRIRLGAVQGDDGRVVSEQSNDGPRAVHPEIGKVRLEQISEMLLEPVLPDDTARVDVVVAGYTDELGRRIHEGLNRGAGGGELGARAHGRKVTGEHHQVHASGARELRQAIQFLQRPLETATASPEKVDAPGETLAWPVTHRNAPQTQADVYVAEMKYSHLIYLTRAKDAGYSARTMKLLTVAAQDLPKVLPMRDAVEAMKSAFAALSAGRVVAPQRGVVPVDEVDGISLLMGGYVPGEGLAAKIVSIFDRNRDLGKNVVTGLVLVLDPVSGEPLGLLDGGALTAWRTGAACGAATDLLARPDARTGALIGSGVQAHTQLLAMDAVRNLEAIRVFGLDPAHVDEFIQRLQPEIGACLERAASADEAVAGADVISSATNSPTPVFDGRALAPGAHLNAIGTFRLDRREVDLVTVERATVFVDLVEAALEEAGELVAGIEAGLTRPEEWAEIGDVAMDDKPGRTRRDEITFFKSVGHAVQDVVAAARVMKRASETGLARTVEL